MSLAREGSAEQVGITVTLNGVPVPIELDEHAVHAIAVAVAACAPPLAGATPFLTVQETAEYLRCSRQRVYDLLSAGRLPRVKEGARTLIRRSDIDTYLQDRPRARQRKRD
jgi:excisionase family DNA binding protein